MVPKNTFLNLIPLCTKSLKYYTIYFYFLKNIENHPKFGKFLLCLLTKRLMGSPQLTSKFACTIELVIQLSLIIQKLSVRNPNHTVCCSHPLVGVLRRFQQRAMWGESPVITREWFLFVLQPENPQMLENCLFSDVGELHIHGPLAAVQQSRWKSTC